MDACKPDSTISRRRFVRVGGAFAASLCAPAVFAVAADAATRRHSGAAKSSASAAAANSAALNSPYATACVMEPVTGTIIFDHDMHRPWPTASLAKMMLMLIVAEKLHDGSLKLLFQDNMLP